MLYIHRRYLLTRHTIVLLFTYTLQTFLFFFFFGSDINRRSTRTTRVYNEYVYNIMTLFYYCHETIYLRVLRTISVGK